MPAAKRTARPLHPILIIFTLMTIAVLLTHILPSGRFQRVDDHVVAGTYKPIDKIAGIPAILATRPPEESDAPAHAAGVVAIFTAIPAGMIKSANLFFMILFVGGMFGILRATGALDAGVDRLLQMTSGNVYLLTAGLMLLLSCGSTFLGFSSAYLALIPLVLRLGQRLGLPNLFAPIVVALADFIGYAASVTNPIALGVAQPIVGVPLFSGIAPRLIVFVVMFAVGLGYVLLYLRRQPKLDHVPEHIRLTVRQTSVVVTLALGGIGLVVGTGLWSWRSPEMGGAFLALGLLIAIVGGLRPSDAADAWLEGMRSMLLPCLTIGLASAIAIILFSSQVMDGIVHGLSGLIDGQAPHMVAMSLMGTEMAFGVIIPSVSSKAAISLPLMAPIAHLSGVSGQVTISALLLGSGMTNMISPTNDLLLAFLAAAKVDYLQWARFIAPLLLLFCIIGFTAIYLMAVLGA